MATPEPTVVFDDPEVLVDRTQMQAEADAAAATHAALAARIPQIRAIYPKLLDGTSTRRQEQMVLAFVLRWLQVQESD